MSGTAKENEIKLAVSDVEVGRSLLASNGFKISRERVFEANVIYDNESGGLRAAGSLVRLRQSGDRAVLTYKGPAEPARHKLRPETEVDVSDFSAMAAILSHLGLKPRFRYEKYRTEFRRGNEPGQVTLDETPIGTFFELEGPADWIDSVAAQLGFGADQYILLSYSTLFLQYCEEQRSTSPDMVFSAKH